MVPSFFAEQRQPILFATLGNCLQFTQNPWQNFSHPSGTVFLWNTYSKKINLSVPTVSARNSWRRQLPVQGVRSGGDNQRCLATATLRFMSILFLFLIKGRLSDGLVVQKMMASTELLKTFILFSFSGAKLSCCKYELTA